MIFVAKQNSSQFSRLNKDVLSGSGSSEELSEAELSEELSETEFSVEEVEEELSLELLELLELPLLQAVSDTSIAEINKTDAIFFI